MKKVINSLKLKNNIGSPSKQNMSMSFDELENNINNQIISNQNISNMIDNLTRSFDNGDIITTPVVVSLENTLPINDVKIDIISDTINAHNYILMENITDTIESAKDAVKLEPNEAVLEAEEDIEEIEEIEDIEDEKDKKNDNLETKVNKKKRNKKKKK